MNTIKHKSGEMQHSSYTGLGESNLPGFYDNFSVYWKRGG